jgi:hypothetical protein
VNKSEAPLPHPQSIKNKTYKIKEEPSLMWSGFSPEIHALLTAETACHYLISVYDITGKKVCSFENNVEGQKEVYLKFHPADQLYLINVNNGDKVETLKVPYIK